MKFKFLILSILFVSHPLFSAPSESELKSTIQDSNNSKEIRTQAIQTLSKMESQEITPFILTLLNTPDPEIEQELIAALGTIASPQAKEGLLNLLQTRSTPFIRLGVIHQLGKLKVKEATPKLKQLLKETSGVDEGLKISIIQALVQMGEPISADAFKGALDEARDPKSKLLILSKINQSNQPELAEVVLPLLQDPNPEVQVMTIYILGNLGNPLAAKSLAASFDASLTGEPQTINYKLLSKLKKGYYIINALKSTYPNQGADLFKRASLPVKLNGQDQPPMQVKNSIRQMREAAFEAMIAAQDPTVVDFIIQNALTEDEEPYARSLAMKTLGSYQKNEGVNLLIQGLQDSNSQVRWEAARALGNFSGQEAIDALKVAEKDPHPQVALEARHSLEAIEKR
jgi:HEAT repeat protein